MILISEDLSEKTLSPEITFNSVYKSKGVKLPERLFSWKRSYIACVYHKHTIFVLKMIVFQRSFTWIEKQRQSSDQWSVKLQFWHSAPQNEAIWPAKNLNLFQMTNFWLLNPIELSLTNKTGYKTIFFALSGAHNTPNTAHRSYLPNLHKKSFPTKISLT